MGSVIFINFACKPGSVENGHLSLLYVTVKLKGIRLLPPADMCRANDPHTVLLRIRFTANLCYHRSGWALTSPFHPCFQRKRSISVALSRESPPADVISYPALWSPDFPHDNTFRQHIARPFGKVTFELYHKPTLLSSDDFYTSSPENKSFLIWGVLNRNKAPIVVATVSGSIYAPL